MRPLRVGGVFRPSPEAQKSTGRIAVCSLLPKTEFRKHLPCKDVVDFVAPEEEPVGAAGSSCKTTLRF